MTGIAPWAKDYIGIPFVSGGRDRNGADCYGLARLILNERFGKALPMLASAYGDANNLAEAKQALCVQRPILAGEKAERPGPGDVCVIKFHGLPVHIGVYAGGGYVLHTLRGTGSVLQRESDPLLSGRIEGWYCVESTTTTKGGGLNGGP